MDSKRKIAKFLNILGSIILIICILLCVPLTIPKLFGLQLYGVVTGSMEPEYPVGSVVYVGKADSETIEPGDVITYKLGSDTDKVMTHRVVRIDEEKQSFITKGDANEVEDAEPVSFQRLIGKPVLVIPKLAAVSDFINSKTGMIIIAIVFLAVFLMWIAAERLKKTDTVSKEEKESDNAEVTNENKDEEKQGKKGWSISTILLLLIGFIIIGVALFVLCRGLLDYKKSNDVYEALNQEYVVVTDIKEVKTTKDWWYKDVKIQLDEVKKINPEVVGWIRFDNNEMLSYPILYAGDNKKYLRTDLYGNELYAGSIFLEAANNPDFQDYHSIIYGHNMRNKSMFGSLKNYREEGYYEENQYFTIYTEEKAYRYHIFAAQNVSASDKVYSVGFQPDEVYQKFIDRIRSRTELVTEVSVTKEDRIVSLSTCSTTGNRYLVHAVLIDTQNHEK